MDSPSSPTGSPGASLPDTPAVRLLAGALTAGLLTAVALPVRKLGRDQTTVRDSFPFSHYPMFSARRREHHWVTHLLGIAADGTSRPLHYGYAGSGGLNAVRRQLRRRVREGQGPLIAERAARRVDARDRPEDRDVVSVQVVRGRYLIEPFMRGAPLDEQLSRLDVRGAAAVPGRDQAGAR